jgi:hypothetical protein
MAPNTQATYKGAFFDSIGHFQTHAAQRSGALRFYPSIPTRLRPTHSFDHLVGNRKQIGRETETKKLTAFWLTTRSNLVG